MVVLMVLLLEEMLVAWWAAIVVAKSVEMTVGCSGEPKAAVRALNLAVKRDSY